MNEKDFERSNDSNLLQSVARFEDMLRQHDSYFFDTVELEEIINYYLSKNKPQKALRAVNFGLNQHPFTTDLLLVKGNILISSGKYDAAIEVLKHIETLGDKSDDLYNNMGDAQMYSGNYTLAMKAYRQALEYTQEQEEKEDLYLQLCFIGQCLGNYETALHYARLSLSITPSNEDALNELALCIESLDAYEKGVDIYTAVIDDAPYTAFAWYHLGVCYKRLGLYEKALQAFDYAVVIDETFEKALEAYADTHFQLSEFKKAVLYYKKLRKVTQCEEEALKKIGNCYCEAGQLSKARYYYKKAIKQTELPAFTDEIWYLMGCTYKNESKLVEAIHCYNKAIQLYDAEPTYYQALGEAYYQRGEEERGLSDMAQAHELDPLNAPANLGYAWYLHKSDQTKKAIDVLQQIFQHTSSNAEVTYMLSGLQLLSGQEGVGMQTLENGLMCYFEEHQKLFEYFPELENNPLILRTINAYEKSSL